MKTRKGAKFGIAFDTNEMPGKVVATTVELSKWVMKHSDKVNVSLCEHSLYPALEEYVHKNPSFARAARQAK